MCHRSAAARIGSNLELEEVDDSADRPRTYRFSITVTVEPGDPAYDDPEWVADAAAGALANAYGYACFFDEIVELVTPAAGSSR